MRKLREFFRSRSGATAVVVSVSLTAVVGGVGLAVDFMRASLARNHLQSSLDAALLAGARAQVAGGDVAAAINGTFTTNWGNREGRLPAMTFTMGSGSITANATLQVPAMMMAALGYTQIPIGVSSGVAFGAGNAEVALVLDTTGSMTGSKLAGAKDAAKQLVDQLYAAPGAASMVKVGLVPFNTYVNVGMSNRHAPWMSVPNDSSSTTNRCGWDWPLVSSTNCRTVTGTCYNDGSPYSCSWTECDNTYGDPVWQCWDETVSYTWNGCAGSRAYPADTTDTVTPSNKVPGVMNVWCPSELRRLSNNPNAVKADIDDMSAWGETYIQAGLLWGWRLLSPNAPFADGAPAGANAKKVMVLMTDGANTKSPNYPDHEGSNATLANNLLVETCNNVKAQGIEIYAIAFDVTEPTITTLLGACASGPPYFYTATTVTELADAFNSIGNSLTRIRMQQ